MNSALTMKDKFKFLCHKEIECFNKCCYDLNLFLTPYDVIRMKNGLGLSSSEFLKKYTTWHIGFNTGLPVVTLRMKNDLKCPFVTKEGCKIYKDRPSSCRLYPLARVKVGDKEYYYIVKEEHCKGFNENKIWSVEEWLKDQEAEIYNKMNDLFMELIAAKQRIGRKLNHEEIQLFYLACFNIDEFRKFALKEGILNKSMDDVELMKFGFKWIKEKVFKV